MCGWVGVCACVRACGPAPRLIHCDLEQVEEDADKLDLASSSYIEKNMKQLMLSLDELTQETMQLANYQRVLVRHREQQAQHLAKRRAEKQAAGENPGNDRDVIQELRAQNHPLFKPLAEPHAVEAVLANARLAHCSTQIAQFSTANLGKLFLSQAVQDQ